MRNLWIAALTLGACAAPAPVSVTPLAAADAATSLAVGESVALAYPQPRPAPEGMDALVTMMLRHADGRALSFEEANHAPDHVMAQAPGGALAQIMGLFGQERPTLYVARAQEHSGAPFICGPQGPAAIGLYETADGAVQIVGLKQEIRFETRPDGVREALPYSPDQVCARLRFRRG